MDQPKQTSKKVLLGLGLILGFVFLSFGTALDQLDPLAYFERSTRMGTLLNPSAARFEQKFDCLRGEISPEGRYGFIAPVSGPVNASEYYILTQYTLAPALVFSSTNPDLIIGYFPAEGDFEKTLAENPDFQVLAQCEENVGLFRRMP